MNIKKRTKDFKLLAIEAVFRNIKPHLRKQKWLQRELSNRTAGYYGEKNVDYMLQIYPNNAALALPDVRLKNKGFEFQLDNIILATHCHIIFETKKWAGELVYDADLKQLIQHHQGYKKRYNCPISQVETQKRNLSAWYLEHGFPVPPIETFVVISNSSTILSNPQQDKHFSEKVFHADLLHEKLDELFSTTHTQTSPSTLTKRILHTIENHRVERFEDILTKMNINHKQLIEGVSCEKCWHPSMERRSRGWHCNHCGHSDKNAHIQTVYDYFLLNGMKPVTNREIRAFLNVPSRKITYTLLQNMGLKMTGNRRHAIYHAPPLSQFPQNSVLPSHNQYRNESIQTGQHGLQV